VERRPPSYLSSFCLVEYRTGEPLPRGSTGIVVMEQAYPFALPLDALNYSSLLVVNSISRAPVFLNPLTAPKCLPPFTFFPFDPALSVF